MSLSLNLRSWSRKIDGWFGTLKAAVAGSPAAYEKEAHHDEETSHDGVEFGPVPGRNRSGLDGAGPGRREEEGQPVVELEAP